MKDKFRNRMKGKKSKWQSYTNKTATRLSRESTKS